MSTRSTLWAAVAAIVFAAITAAQPTDRTRAPTAAEAGLPAFNAYDANRDGRVSPSESASDAQLSGQFEGLDRDRSGDLDAAEFARFEGRAPARPAEPFDRPAPDDRLPPREPVPPPAR